MDFDEDYTVRKKAKKAKKTPKKIVPAQKYGKDGCVVFSETQRITYNIDPFGRILHKEFFTKQQREVHGEPKYLRDKDFEQPQSFYVKNGYKFPLYLDDQLENLTIGRWPLDNHGNLDMHQNVCEKCGTCKQDEGIVLCDCCTLAYHRSCLTKDQLNGIDDDSVYWLCPHKDCRKIQQKIKRKSLQKYIDF